jgi:hypothetical protein
LLSQLLQRFLNHVDCVLSKVDSSPFEHLGLVHQVSHSKLLALSDELSILNSNVLCSLFFEKTLCFFDVGKCFSISDLDLSVEFMIKLRILSLHISFLNQNRDFFELVETVVRMVKHDSCEDFTQVRVKV